MKFNKFLFIKITLEFLHSVHTFYFNYFILIKINIKNMLLLIYYFYLIKIIILHLCILNSLYQMMYKLNIFYQDLFNNYNYYIVLY